MRRALVGVNLRKIPRLFPIKGAREKECCDRLLKLQKCCTELTWGKRFATVEALASNQGSLDLLCLSLNAGSVLVGHQPRGKAAHEEHFSGSHFPGNQAVTLAAIKKYQNLLGPPSPAPSADRFTPDPELRSKQL